MFLTTCDWWQEHLNAWGKSGCEERTGNSCRYHWNKINTILICKLECCFLSQKLGEGINLLKPVVLQEELYISSDNSMYRRGSRSRSFTHPLAFAFRTRVWQDSSTDLQFPLLFLAVIVLMEDVKTTLFRLGFQASFEEVFSAFDCRINDIWSNICFLKIRKKKTAMLDC